MSYQEYVEIQMGYRAPANEAKYGPYYQGASAPGGPAPANRQGYVETQPSCRTPPANDPERGRHRRDTSAPNPAAPEQEGRDFIKEELISILAKLEGWSLKDLQRLMETRQLKVSQLRQSIRRALGND